MDVLSIPLETAGHEAVAWFAGILEGEGSFMQNRGSSARVTVGMTDRDVIERCQALVGGRMSVEARAPKKDLYVLHLYGQRARRTMEIVLPHMGRRRAAKIIDLLAMPGWGFHDTKSVLRSAEAAARAVGV